MGFWSSIGSAISGAFSSVCSAFSSGISALGSAVAGFATKVLPTLSKVIPNLSILSTVANVATGLLQALGILDEDEDVEDKGRQVVYAKELGIDMDDFPSFEDYLARLDELEVDDNVIKDYNQADKIIAGLAVCSTAMDTKLNLPEGMSGNLWILNAFDPDYFNADRLDSIINSTTDFQTIVDYFTDSASPQESMNVEKDLVAIEQKINPDVAVPDIYKEIDSIKNSVAKLIE